MSPLTAFLIILVSATTLLIVYLTKQFQEENQTYSSIKLKSANQALIKKTIEKEKIVAETLNGRFAMLGLVAAIGAYLTTGQIIPGFI